MADMRVNPSHKFKVKRKVKDILLKYKDWYFCSDSELVYFSDERIDWLNLSTSKELNVSNIKFIMRRKTTLKGIDSYLLGTVNELLDMLEVTDSFC